MDSKAHAPESGSLRKRLLLTLAAALAPVLIMAAISTVLQVRDSTNERRQRLVIRAEGAVAGAEQALFQAEALLELSQKRIISGDCAAVFDDLSPIIPPLTNVTHFGIDGMSTCSAKGDGTFPITDKRWFDQIGTDTEFLRTDSFYGPVSKDWIFAILLPERDETGALKGVLSFALAASRLAELIDESALASDMEIALVDREGKSYGSTRFQSVPLDWVSLVKDSPTSQLFAQTSDDGVSLDMVLQPLGGTDIYAAISRPAPGFWSAVALQPTTTFGLPLLAFAIALLAVSVAIDRLVLKWLARIRRVARVYGGGRYSFKSEDSFVGAPDEITTVVRSLDQMAHNIQERDGALREAIETRNAAVKEIHHRVKNNLQIVTSFLSLQGRQLDDPVAKSAIADARNRINALAIVHQTLYQHERLETVNLKPFVESLISHLREGLAMGEQGISISQEIAEIERPADDAIPIALFAVEAITNAVKYAFENGGGQIQVHLEQKPTGIELSIFDDGRGIDEASQVGKGLGSKLMKAFSRQLGGSMTVETAPGKGYRCVLTLPLTSRHAKPQA